MTTSGCTTPRLAFAVTAALVASLALGCRSKPKAIATGEDAGPIATDANAPALRPVREVWVHPAEARVTTLMSQPYSPSEFRAWAGERFEVRAEADGGLPETPWLTIAAGKRASYLLARAEVSLTPVTESTCLDQAGVALRQLDAPLGIAWQEAMHATQSTPDSFDGWSLVALLAEEKRAREPLTAQDEEDLARARGLLAALKAAPQPAEPPVARPEVGATNFVSATSLKVRASASASAPVVATLPLNTEVEVLSVGSTFARVRWAASRRSVVVVTLEKGAPEGQAVEPAAAGGGEGHVAVAFLAPQRATPEALAAEADAARVAGAPQRAARLLERAVFLSESPADLEAKLLDAAVAARLYPLALQVRARLQPESAEGPALPVAAVQLYFGCKTQPPLEEALAACVAEVDTLGECPLTAPATPAAVHQLEGNDAPPTPEELTSFKAELARHQTEVAARERRQAGLRAKVDKKRELFPSGPWLHATVTSNAKLTAQGARAFVYAVPFGISDTCGNVTATLALDDLRLADLGAWPTAGAVLDVWATGAGYEHVAWGVLPAASRDEAISALRARAEKGINSRTPGLLVPGSSAVGAWRICPECGC